MRLLIIEDNSKLASSIKKGLEQESFAVDIAPDGEYGYDLASTENYDLVILDRMLPGLDGLKLCQKLRDHSISIPILMLTALGELGNKVEGLNSGADDYLVKPFAFEELLARIRALTRRPKETLPNNLKIADLNINLTSYQVARAGKNIPLSKKEFSLLYYLASNKGQVLSKEQIIDKVWDFDSDILPNTVEVYIGYLREKIDRPFKTKLIKTIRGFGYQLTEN